MVNGGRPSPSILKQTNTPKKKPKFVVKVHPPNNDSQAPRSSGLEAPADAARTFSQIRSRYVSMISPRSSNYELLEGGHGPTRTASKRFAWKKFAIAAVVLITLVYLFGPRESRVLQWKSKPTDSGTWTRKSYSSVTLIFMKPLNLPKRRHHITTSTSMTQYLLRRRRRSRL